MSDYPQYSDPPAPVQPGTSFQRWRLFWMVCLMLVLVVLFILPSLVERVQFAATRGEQRAKAEVAGELLDRIDIDNVYRRVVQAIEPSVVGVKTRRIIRGRGDELTFLFRRPRVFSTRGQGSGVIVDEAGYIITNFHVIDQATEVTVELSDGRTIFDVEIVGADAATDVAVLKIDADGLTAASWGKSDELEVGDPVLAVGSPFGLAQTVTAGIVSAKRRRGIVENLSYQDFLQTDAAVNPGNSGGPLVNMKGKVVGINTAIVGQSYQGISFAIPSRLAQEVYDGLKATGEVARGWLGVITEQLDPSLVDRLGLPDANGALVKGVWRGSPAEAADIELNDVIVAWNDQPIDDPAELGLAVAGTKIGSQAQLELIRHGKRRTVRVTVRKRPKSLP